MKPYFDAHSAGLLLLIALLAWLSMEVIQFARQWRWRAAATRIGRRSFWLGFGACLIATNLALYLGPSVFPAAAIRPGAVVRRGVGGDHRLADSHRGDRLAVGARG